MNKISLSRGSSAWLEQESPNLHVVGSNPTPATNLPGIRVGLVDGLGSQFPASQNGCEPLLSGIPAPYSSTPASPGRIMTPPGDFSISLPTRPDPLNLALAVGVVTCAGIWLLNLFS